MNKVVVHHQEGGLIKGVTNDFLPTKDRFHLVPLDSPPESKPLEILVADLKGVFFVKDFAGNPGHKKSAEFDPTKPVAGRKIKITFKDGEVLVGTTQGYQPGRPGFFVIPADPESNNERCFVISAATKEVSFL